MCSKASPEHPYNSDNAHVGAPHLNIQIRHLFAEKPLSNFILRGLAAIQTSVKYFAVIETPSHQESQCLKSGFDGVPFNEWALANKFILILIHRIVWHNWSRLKIIQSVVRPPD
mmetsp:Transcript_104471/g.184248  ORF Transcript_104471/g.184248 Transcript_104471/m.184248 type:complete len:114 (-) Transcript_104471:245-586(-)